MQTHLPPSETIYVNIVNTHADVVDVDWASKGELDFNRGGVPKVNREGA
jgi:hypothetical protein